MQDGDALPFARLWYTQPDTVATAIGPSAIYFAFLVSDSVRPLHIAVAESAMRPSHGRRSRTVMTMLMLSWSFIDAAVHRMRRSAFYARPHPTDVLPQSMKRFFH